MVPTNATEKIDITQINQDQSKSNQETSLLGGIFDDTDSKFENCTLLPSRYKEPVLTQLETNFLNFMQGNCLPFKIEIAEDFPVWLESLSRYLRYLGLPTVISEIIDAITNKRSIRFQPDEDVIIKQMIMASCKLKAVFRYGTTAQQTLYSVIHSLGMIKSYEEIYKLIDNFAIDIREPVYTSLRKFNVLEFICKISNTPLNSKSVLSNIIRSFPDNMTFEPLVLLVEEYLNLNKKVGIGKVIEEIYEKVRKMCIIRPLESVFDFSDSGSDSTNAAENISDYDEITNDHNIGNKRFNKSKNFNNNKIGKKWILDPSLSDLCIHCCNKHSSRNCPNRWNGICSWCDTYGHKKKNCLARKVDEAEKKVAAVMSTESGRSVLVDLFKKDPNLRSLLPKKIETSH